MTTRTRYLVTYIHSSNDIRKAWVRIDDSVSDKKEDALRQIQGNFLPALEVISLEDENEH